MRLRTVHGHSRLSTTMTLLVVCVLCASCFGVAKNAKYWRAISEYQTAAPLELKPIQGSSSNCNKWELEHTLPTGVRVSIFGRKCGPGSPATVKYSDEAQERFVYEYFDFVYPADMRIQGDVLYTLVSGQTVFGNPYTLLIVYDLGRRMTLREVKIDSKDLPESPSWR